MLYNRPCKRLKHQKTLKHFTAILVPQNSINNLCQKVFNCLQRLYARYFIVTAEKQVTVPFSPCVCSKEGHEISKEWHCKHSQLPITHSMQEV